MSYDIDLECPHCGKAQSSGLNYTYNLGPMFRWALGGNGLADLHGLEAKVALVRLTMALAKCEMDGDLQRFDSPNGWGTGHGAYELLKGLRDEILEHGEMRLLVRVT